MKRPNGSGCVRKLTGKRRKPWAVYVTTGYEDGGKQKQIYLGTFARRMEAERYLSQYDGYVPETINITMESVFNLWIKSKSQLCSTSINSYNAAWQWMSSIKDKRIREVTPQDLQNCVELAIKDGKSRATCEIIRVVAHGIFKYATKENICVKDASNYFEMPREKKTAKTIFTDEEIATLKAMQGDKWAESVLVMIYTGMRVSEMLGLTKDNVDLVNRRIVGAGIKTDAGKLREIPIHGDIYDMLCEACKQDGYLYGDNGELIPSTTYRYRYFYPLMDQLGMKHTPHGCRHTTASLLVRNNVPPELAKYILGHSKYSTTVEIYTHPQLDALLQAINKI